MTADSWSDTWTPATYVYFADGRNQEVGNLYRMDMNADELVVETVGALSHPITGLAFSPDGTLYATEALGYGGGSHLLIIDVDTLEVTEVGVLQTSSGSTHSAIHDITFVGSRLIGWSESGDDPVEIDIATGEVTVMYSSSEGTSRTALAADAEGTTYLLPHGPYDRVVSVDASSGETSALGDITCEADCNGSGGATFHNGMLMTLDFSWGSSIGLGVVDLDTMTYSEVFDGIPEGVDSLASPTP